MIEKYSMELDSKKHPILIRENEYDYQDIRTGLITLSLLFENFLIRYLYYYIIYTCIFFI